MKYNEREIRKHMQEVRTAPSATSSLCPSIVDPSFVGGGPTKKATVPSTLLDPSSRRPCDEMPPKSGYRYRYKGGDGAAAADEDAPTAPATPGLNPIHKRRQPSTDTKCQPVSTPPTQLRPRLPRTSISKIPRQVQGGSELSDSAPSSIASAQLRPEQQEQHISSLSPNHQIESSDDTVAASINIAKSRYLTFSKDQATSHFKQLQVELNGAAKQQELTTRSPLSSPILGNQKQQQEQPERERQRPGPEPERDHQQMTIDISDRRPHHRHFRRRRDEPLIAQVNNVYDNLFSNECKSSPAVAVALGSPRFRCEESQQAAGECERTTEPQQQQPQQQSTSPPVRPRPLDRLSKQQVFVDIRAAQNDEYAAEQFIDVVGLDEGNDHGRDKGGGDCGGDIGLLQRQTVKPQAITRLHDRFARNQNHQRQQQQHQLHNHQQQQPICEAFIMTGQSMLKLSCNETENSNHQTATTTTNKTTTHTNTITTGDDAIATNENHVGVRTTSAPAQAAPTETVANSQSWSNGLDRKSTSPVDSDELDVEQKAGLNNNNNNCVSVRTSEQEASSFAATATADPHKPNLLTTRAGGDISCNKEAAHQQQGRPSRVDEQAEAGERATVGQHEQQQRLVFSQHEPAEGAREWQKRPSQQQQQQQKQTSKQTSRIESGQKFEHIELLSHKQPKVAASHSDIDMDPHEKPVDETEAIKPESETQASCHDRESARRLAKRLYNLSGFKRSDVCHHLAKNNPFSQMVAEEYLCLFDFRSIKLDAALRKFLSKLQLNGETQERERVLSQFSQRYFDCNKDKFPNSDTIQTLVCAMILLNTDLHGNHFDKKLKRNKRTKLSLGAFIDGLNNSIANEPGQCGNGQSANLASQISASNINPVTTPNTSIVNPPYTFPRHLLVDLYESIKKRPLKCGEDKCDMTSYEAELDRIYSQQLGISGNNNSRSSTLPTRRFAPGSHATSSTLNANSRRQLKHGLGRMHSSEMDFSIEFKSGFLNRKRTFEARRKPTSKGRRGWRRIFVILKDLRLIIRYNQEEPVAAAAGEGDKQQQQQQPLSAKEQQISSKLKKQMIARDMKNTIKLHHAFAKRMPGYTKREYVFQVLFADQSEMLMQANSEQEMNSWIDTINFASACLSSPALPTAVSNSKRYLQRYQARSILPASYTKLSYWEQLIDHEERLQRLKQELEEHLNEAPNTRNADKRSKSEFIEKIAYLRLDIERYSVYVDLMRKKSNSPEAIILSKHPQIASLTSSDEIIQSLPSFAPPKLDEDPSPADDTATVSAM